MTLMCSPVNRTVIGAPTRQRASRSGEDALGSADSKNNLLWLINNAGKPAAQQAQGRKDQPAAPASSFSEFTLNI